MIERYQLETVKLSDLIFDKENPNEMSDAQEKGLVKSFNMFGDVQPITIDQNNVILSGNHRAKKQMEMGETEIQVFRRHFKDDKERRQFSQAMNKLHGEYDPIKDSTQLMKIMQDGGLDDLCDLIAQPKEEIQKLFDAEKNNELDGLLNSGGSLKYLTLEFYFDNEDRERVQDWMAFFKHHFNVKSNGEVFIKLAEAFEETHKDVIITKNN